MKDANPGLNKGKHTREQVSAAVMQQEGLEDCSCRWGCLEGVQERERGEHSGFPAQHRLSLMKKHDPSCNYKKSRLIATTLMYGMAGSHHLLTLAYGPNNTPVLSFTKQPACSTCLDQKHAPVSTHSIIGTNNQ